MTSALDAERRARLERLVTRARRILESDLLDGASGRLGIDPDGTVADEEALRLRPTALAQRRDLVEVIDHLRSEGEDPAGAVARLLREATFTHLNRLIAIRIAEALALLPPSLADGRRSQGFRDLLELAPSLADDDTGGYWTYLGLCGDELAGDVPALFDPRNPLLALMPSPGALDDLVELLADPETVGLWDAPDCLGWVYQFFNTGDERRAMREASVAPRDSRELAVRNQFFTPRYVVDFLVQNSLGRRLMDADPNSSLLADLPLLIDPPTEAGEPIDLDEVSLLDPACGSGHFLLAGYDVLEAAWLHAGSEPAQAAPAIIRALWGIDIDPRCTQVAAAAIVFRARRSCPTGKLPRPNVICARSLPATSTGLDEILTSLPAAPHRLIETATSALSDAPILGSLLKIEERLREEVRAVAVDGPAPRGSFADLLAEESLQELQDELLDELRRAAGRVIATPAERLLGAEANDAVRFVQAMTRRYDAVCMNPPFGEPVQGTKSYLKSAYPWIPTRDYNLLAAFVGRGVELCKPGGYVGAITSRAGMFLKTFEPWREQVLLGHQLVALADLGYGVMEQALVEAAAYVVGAVEARPDHEATFVRLLKDLDRPSGLRDAIAASRRGDRDGRVYRVPLGDFRAVPGSPVAYWMGPSIRRLFAEHPRLEGHGGDVRQGLATGDDFRFVRTFWEVSADRIARSREETTRGKRWLPFAKGGEYSPYWADIYLVVDWESDGERIRGYSGARPQNLQYFFRPGLTWPLRTASGFGIRVLPAGCAFGHKGPAIFADGDDPLAMLVWLKSRLVQVAIDAMVAAGGEASSGGAARSYEVGLVQKLPWIADVNVSLLLRHAVAEIIDLRRQDDMYDETSRSFNGPAALPRLACGEPFYDAVEGALSDRTARWKRILSASLATEQEIQRIAALDATAIDYLDEEMGPHPAAYPRGDLDEKKFARLYQAPIEAVIDESIAEKGGSRSIANLTFFADRRLEVLAHAFERPVEQLVAARDKLRLLPPEEPAHSALEIFSYLVGVAFGRWDLRIGSGRAAPGLAPPFDPVPVRAPGALVEPDDGPLASPPEGILLDQAGHQLDIDDRIVRAAGEIVASPEKMLSEVLAALGRRACRDYLRKAFFKAHLSMYSKSRRKAPIYWPLYVPSGVWGAWVYAPALSRETLFAIAGAAGERLDQGEAEIRRLQREREVGGAGRSIREVVTALETEEQLVEELRRFRYEAARIADLGWEPDLDDGIVLCAAPLADLFPSWTDLAATREAIRVGKYPWAAVSRWADQL